VSEVLIDGEGFGDAELVHDHEAQAVDEAVALVAMTREISKGGLLLGRSRPVNTRELFAVELLAHQHRSSMIDLRLSERDGLGDDVIGRDQQS
jgi:hypothetical protein